MSCTRYFGNQVLVYPNESVGVFCQNSHVARLSIHHIVATVNKPLRQGRQFLFGLIGIIQSSYTFITKLNIDAFCARLVSTLGNFSCQFYSVYGGIDNEVVAFLEVYAHLYHGFCIFI